MDEDLGILQTTPEKAELQRRKTFTKNKWIFSFSGIGRDMAYQLIASFLLTYIQFGVSLTLVQFTTISIIIGVIGRIWDGFNDPMMGAIIEGSHFKRGKFRPWILIGALTCGLVIILMFNIQNIPGWNFVVFMSIMYLLWESTFTMNDIGYWAMLPSLSSVKEERNSITTLTVLFAGIGAIIAQAIIPMFTVGDMRAGYRTVAILIGVVFIISQLVTYLGIKELPRKTAEKSEKISLKKMWKTIRGNDQILWMTLSMLCYNIGNMLLIALAANLIYMELSYNGSLYFYIVAAYGITNVLVTVLYPLLVSKLGRKKLQTISITVACIGYVLIALMGWLVWFPFKITTMCAFIVLISCGQSLFYTASIVNMTNCIEYNEYKQGTRNEAVVSTLRPFMAKFAAAMHTLIITLVLAISGAFILSQSISTLETQRDFFAKIGSPSDQSIYVEKVKGYIKEFGNAQFGTAEYDAASDKVKTLINNDKIANKYKIDPKYVPALADAMIIRSIQNESKTEMQKQELGRLSHIDISLFTETPTTGRYTYSLEIGELKSGGESAANIHFRDKVTLSMRIWLRIAVTVLPIILLSLALIVQRKKFFIDEDYYDMMVAEINKRQ